MGFYEPKVFKTISGCDPEYWGKFAHIVKAKNSDVSKTINRMVEEFVFRWQQDNSIFSHEPLDRQSGIVVRHVVAPYYKKPKFFDNSLDRAA